MMTQFFNINFLPIISLKQEFSISLSQQQKKIGAIILVVFACLALCYLSYRSCFSVQARKLNDDDKDDQALRPGILETITSLIQAGNPESKDDKVSRLLLEAKAAKKKRLYGEAGLKYEEALKIDAQNVKALIAYGRCLIYEKKYQEAEANLSKALTLDPKNSKALTRFAASLLEQDDANKAQAYLEEALKLKPEDVAALCYYAKTLLKQNKPLYALDEIDKALQLQPEAPFAHLVKGDILFSLNNIDAAVASYTSAIRMQTRKSTALVDCLLELHGKGKSQADLAIKLCQTLMTLKNKKHVADFAEILCKNGHLDDAEVIFKCLVSLYPHDVLALSHYAEVLFKLDKFQEALTIFENVIQLDPQNALAQSYLNKTKDALDAKE